jgi:tRNA(adenine34) deaminase
MIANTIETSLKYNVTFFHFSSISYDIKLGSALESPFGSKADIFYMQHALAQAHKAYKADEVPVGAIVVNAHGDIIARGYNQVEKKNTQVAHAEMAALMKAGIAQHGWRLLGCWLYVTLEPCAMCMHAVLLSRLEGVVYGAPSPLFGYHLDKDMAVQLYKSDTLKIIDGVCGNQAADLLKTFFQEKRKRSG